MLHITNGSSVSLAQAVRGVVLPWDDILHEGPVAAGPLEAVSESRSQFLTEYTGRPVDLSARDAVLKSFGEHEEVVLWFEHDLFDQLQLIQLLTWFGGQRLGSTALSLVQASRHLGPMQPAELAALFPRRKPVSDSQTAVAAAAWRAFTDSLPGDLLKAASCDFAELPYLGAALRRLLEQYPSRRNGLARTEQQILDAAAESADPREWFGIQQRMEEAPLFLGDTTFFKYVDGLRACPSPLLDGSRLTAAGVAVREGRDDHLARNGIDRWIGGVHLAGRHSPYRW